MIVAGRPVSSPEQGCDPGSAELSTLVVACFQQPFGVGDQEAAGLEGTVGDQPRRVREHPLTRGPRRQLGHPVGGDHDRGADVRR